MKALKISLIVLASLLLISGAGYLYASSGVKSKPGYAKLASPQGHSVNASISLNIGPGGVAPVRWLVEKFIASSEQQHELPERIFQRVLKDLEGVQLRVYEIGHNRPAFDQAIAESVAALKQKNWQTLATIRDEDEHVVVMHTGNDEQIDGLSIMLSSHDNAVFLNLIGRFNTQTIAAAVNELNRDKL
ncbi:DUF4252 domain-containing protein [Arenicella xantha]|uniref:Uncharacterized protein DUF4252 n=1 Tax=Arenicella xantha TaxID=644221 RepID=A0A395JKF3_9GAMM|nr:DUF4252 domain-containing protein [Arenicella xantha]RBP51263.1 uncharacterized protein DUF4252 [Arenicella xantha]